MDLVLKTLTCELVSQEYVNWFSDMEVTKFSDNQYKIFSIESQKKYVENCINNADSELYGVFDHNRHIGNIMINDLQNHHRNAKITYVIGDKSYWGKGVGSFAVAEIIKKASYQFHLNKLCAGIADENIGSKKVLEKNGFLLEGIREKHLFYNGKFYNQLDYGLVLIN
jgi:[ribosomal protein S5]-alanine N-acetyltransferase